MPKPWNCPKGYGICWGCERPCTEQTPEQIRAAFKAMEEEQREEHLDHLRRIARVGGRSDG